MKKFVLIFLLLSSSIFAQTYTDMLGRNVEINSAKKLVFVGPGALRLGVYLGLKESVVGVEKFELMAKEDAPYRAYLGKEFFQKLPIIGNGGPGKMPNLEALINVKADVIFTSFIQKEQIELITQKTGIPVVALSYGSSYGGKGVNNLVEIESSLILISQIVGKEQRALKLVEFIKKESKLLSSLNLPSKKLYIGGVAYKGIQPLTSTEVNYPPFELLGVKNALFIDNPSAKGHQFVDFEALLKTDPDIIFTDMYSKKKIDQDYKENKALYDTLKAYASSSVKEVLSFNNYSTNVENLMLIPWQIASYLGEDVNLNQKAKEIFNAFYEVGSQELLSKMAYDFEAK